MKKVLLLSLLLISLVSTNFVSAQNKGDFALGGGVSFGTAIPTASLGIIAHYNIDDRFRLAGNLDYFIKNQGVSTFDVTVDAHYLIPLNNTIAIYPLAGIGISALSVWGESRVPFVANIGVGCQFNVAQNFRIGVEMKGRLGNGVSQFIVGPSFMYAF